MRKFKANKKEFMYCIAVYGVFVFLILVLGWIELYESWLFFAFLGFFVWLYLDTVYGVKEGKLYYRSAFIRGAIAVSSIHEIGVGETMWVGMKPALARKGLVVRFNKFDEIYIAPLDNYELVDALVAINPEIKVVDKRKQPS